MDIHQLDIPIGISNRHVHLTQDTFDILFGKGTPVRKLKAVKQPGFYAAYETIDIEGPKGRINKVRLVAPHRSRNQIEVSRTDAIALGLRPPVRESGDLAGSCPIRLIGPQGTVEVQEGLVIALRHVHFSPAEAQAVGAKNGEIVRVRVGVGGDRETVFGNVIVRVSDQYSLELHLDTDEANAAGVKMGDIAHIV